jgi:hypothetical protein
LILAGGGVESTVAARQSPGIKGRDPLISGWLLADRIEKRHWSKS